MFINFELLWSRRCVISFTYRTNSNSNYHGVSRDLFHLNWYSCQLLASCGGWRDYWFDLHNCCRLDSAAAHKESISLENRRATMALTIHIDNDKSPSLATENIERLLLQCHELERRNEILKQENDELKQKLKHERSSYQVAFNTMQHGMDDMKKTTSELEDKVNVLLRVADTMESGTLEESANNESDPGKNVQSEVELQRVLCRIWKKRYQELKNQVDDRSLLQEDEVHRSHDCVVQTEPKKGKRAPRGLSLKRLTRGRSMPPKRFEGNQIFVRIPSRRSSGTNSTAECTSESNSCDTSSSLGSDPSPCERFMVSSMPWKSEHFGTNGLYYGQIDSISRPDGLGVFHYVAGCDNVKYFVRGEWRQGKLLPSNHAGSTNWDGASNLSDNDDISVTEL